MGTRQLEMKNSSRFGENCQKHQLIVKTERDGAILQHENHAEVKQKKGGGELFRKTPSAI
ncbi:hypothetical protein PM082_016394 [Marasmius tenuissimus]|nr:hypothetical protein PM082_016394 [Marasmius tenuissimus]